MTSSFTDKLAKRKGAVCVGLDSNIAKLPACLNNEQDPQLKFNQAIIDATSPWAAAYKPNLAFYLSRGAVGLDTLAKTIAYVPSNIPVILDAKFGDIGNTMAAYAQACFTQLGASAVTANPLMGADVWQPILDIPGSYVFLLGLTSNPGAADFLKPNNLYQDIAKHIANLPADRVGAVVGGTQVDELATCRKLMPQTVFLVPGIGAQGGSLASVIKYAAASSADSCLLINSSRGIIFASDGNDFAEEAAKQTEQLHQQINQLLQQ